MVYLPNNEASNNIGDQGLIAIANNLKHLTELMVCTKISHIGSNNIGDEGAMAIATNLKQLSKLDIKHNKIGDDGALAIANSLERLSRLEIGTAFQQLREQQAVAIVY